MCVATCCHSIVMIDHESYAGNVLACPCDRVYGMELPPVEIVNEPDKLSTSARAALPVPLVDPRTAGMKLMEAWDTPVAADTREVEGAMDFRALMASCGDRVHNLNLRKGSIPPGLSPPPARTQPSTCCHVL
jgi:hypothetical protein